MRDQTPRSRRRTIRSIASITIGSLALTSVGGATRTPPDGPCTNAPDRFPGRMAAALTRRPNTYIGVVDRIVDGAHVVLLLEDGGELVDQHVAPREALPDVTEGDALVVVISADELLYTREIDIDVADRMQERFDCLSEPLDG